MFLQWKGAPRKEMAETVRFVIFGFSLSVEDVLHAILVQNTCVVIDCGAPAEEYHQASATPAVSIDFL